MVACVSIPYLSGMRRPPNQRWSSTYASRPSALAHGLFQFLFLLKFFFILRFLFILRFFQAAVAWTLFRWRAASGRAAAGALLRA